MRAIQMEQFGDPAQVIRVVDSRTRCSISSVAARSC